VRVAVVREGGWGERNHDISQGEWSSRAWGGMWGRGGGTQPPRSRRQIGMAGEERLLAS